MTSMTYTPNRGHKNISAALFMVVGALIVFGSVVLLNRYVESTGDKDVKSQVNFDVPKKAPQKQQKVVKQQQPKPKPQTRPVAPPPANLDSIIGGVDVGLGFSLDEMGRGDGILGDLSDVAMNADSVDDLPVPSARPMLDYPKRARSKGITGYVKFNLLINTTGQIEKVKILEAMPAGVFEQAATDNIKQWKFEPAVYQGKPVKGWFEQTIRFDLN
jgi:periplasmic protein TonB